MKCPICGFEVDGLRWRSHREASHPDYVQWVRGKVRLTMFVILPSWGALFVLDALFGGFLDPLFFAVIAYVLGTLILVILVERGKLRELRAGWKETHPLFEEATKA
jgi:hypothetical protein